jgi:archaellum biogenesis ATPase FlaH
MNPYQQGLSLVFTGEKLEAKLFPTDYALIIDNIYKYKEKVGKLPSIDYFISVAGKFAGAKEKQVTSILKSLRPTDMSSDEVIMLLEDEYKKDKIRDAIEQSLELIETDVDMALKKIKDLVELDSVSKEVDYIDIDDEEIQRRVQLIKLGLSEGDEPFNVCPIPSLCAIGSAPSKGKTLLALKMMAHRFLEGDSVLYVSTEIEKLYILKRLISLISKVPFQEVISGNYSVKEHKEAVKRAELCIKYDVKFNSNLSNEQILGKPLRENKIYIIAPASRQDMVCGKGSKGVPDARELVNDIESHCRDLGVKMFFVDNLSDINYNYGNDVRDDMKIGKFCQSLRRLAILYDGVAWILVHSDNISDEVKYSKRIGQLLDLQLGIDIPKEMVELEMVMLSVFKNRNGQGYKSYPFKDFRWRMDYEFTGEDPVEVFELKKMMKKGNN